MDRKHKYIYIGLFTVLMVGTGLAAWFLFVSEGFTGYVVSTSGNPLNVTATFGDITLDTRTGEAVNTTTLTLENYDGDIDMVINYTVTKDDWADDCTDYEDDCDVEISFEGTPVLSDDTITVPSGESDLTATITCQKLSCPQDIGIEVELKE